MTDPTELTAAITVPDAVGDRPGATAAVRDDVLAAARSASLDADAGMRIGGMGNAPGCDWTCPVADPDAPPLPDPAVAAPDELVCPLPADAGQRAAVLAVARGRSFAVIGGPGTGKRQTLANLIAQALSARRRVLVVGREPASLDALRLRLADAGISQFALPLHGHNATPWPLRARLRAAWLSGAAGDVAARATEVARHAELGAGFDALLARLHVPHAGGMTLHGAIAGALTTPDASGLPTAHGQMPGATVPPVAPGWPAAAPLAAIVAPVAPGLPVTLDLPGPHDPAALAGLRALAARVDEQAARVGIGAGAPSPDDALLDLVGEPRWSVEWQLGLDEAAAGLRAAIDVAAAAVQDWRRALDLPALGLDAATRRGLRLLAEQLANPPSDVDPRLGVSAGAGGLRALLDDGLALLRERVARRAALPAPWPDAVQRAVRVGLQLLADEARQMRELGPVWPQRTLDELGRGAELLARWRRLRGKLSAPYRPEVAQLDSPALLAEWNRAESLPWPLRGLRRRRVLDQLRACAEAGATPDAAVDLRLLAELAGIEPAIAALDRLRMPGGDGPWRGFDTNLDVLGASFVFQRRLAGLRAGDDWSNDGLGHVAEGAAGAALSDQYRRVRELLRLRGAIDDLDSYDNLGHATGGVWDGRASDPARLRAALALHGVLAGLADGGPLAPGWDAGIALAPPADAAPAPAAGAFMPARITGLEDLFGALHALAGCEQRLDQASPLTELLPELWQGCASDAGRLGRVADFFAGLDDACREIGGPGPRQADVRQRLDSFFARMLAAPAAELAAIAPARVAHLVAEAALDGALDAFCARAGSTPAARERLGALGLPALIGLLQRLPAVLPRLPAWCDWCQVRAAALAAGLAPLVEAIESGRLAPGQGAAAFEQAWLRGWIDATIDADPLLRDFDFAAHEAARREYRELDDRLRLAARERVRAALRGEGRLPNPEALASVAPQDLADDGGMAGEWLLLLGEIDRATEVGKHTSDAADAAPLAPAELFTRAGNALLRLTPCVLATPDALGSDIPDGQEFDLVIADACDGLGAATLDRLATRAGQFVIVGAAPDGLPAITLATQHRLRHTALADFSRARGWLDARQLPAPVTTDDARQWHRLPPRADAEACARVVARHLCTQLRLAAIAAEADAITAGAFGGDRIVVPRRVSFGVIATDPELRVLIDGLLAAERAADPALDAFFDADQPEPLVVRDLSGLACGDARDVIYLAAPPGASGLPAARLHLALTRARATLHVFAAVPRPALSADTRLPASAPRAPDSSGIRLPGATEGRLPDADEFALLLADLADAAEPRSHPRADAFADVIAAGLGAHGWRVANGPGEGDGAGRVLLTVADPDRPWNELAAVEFDAPGLLSLDAADREIAREARLRALGWELLRVSVLDAWRTPEALFARLDDELGLLLTRRRRARGMPAAAPMQALAREQSTPAPQPPTAPLMQAEPVGAEVIGARPTVAVPIETTPNEATPNEAAPVEAEPVEAGPPDAAPPDAAPIDAPVAATPFEAPATEPPPADFPAIDALPPINDAVDGPEADATPALPEAPVSCASPAPLPVPEPGVYRESDPVCVLPAGVDPAVLVADDVLLRAMALHVVDFEGPVREDVLVRRIRHACGLGDDDGSLLARVRVLIADRPVTFEGSRVFVWPRRGGIDRFRHPGGTRPLDEISHAELAALARELEADGRARGADPAAAIIAMAACCAIGPMSDAARDRLELAWLARGHRPG